jgi:hypothetical protein
MRRELEGRYPDLRIVIEGATTHCRGSFPVIHQGKVLDRFQLEIVFASDHPRSLPAVFEVGGRIPRTIDSHVFGAGGRACLGVEEDLLLTFGSEPSFTAFLSGPVHNYYLGQSLVALGKPWPFGERSHGIDGLVETYGGWFGTQDEATVVRYLEYLGRGIIKGHWDCVCGSGKKLRQCHVEDVRASAKRVPQALARSALEKLRYFQKVRDAAKR